MKDKTEQAAKDYANLKSRTDSEEIYYNREACRKYDDFTSGAEWMQDQYKGLTPEIVNELLEAVSFSIRYFENDPDRCKSILMKAENKAFKELKS